IGVEASGGSRYWVREFKKHGHDAKMIPAQFVKPFVKSDKNDANDAEAICEAVQRPNMRFVAEKTIEQQEIQMLHRVRSGVISHRTHLCNEMRAVLLDHGITVRQGLVGLREKLSDIFSDPKDLSELSLTLLQSLKNLWDNAQSQIEKLDQQLEIVFERHE